MLAALFADSLAERCRECEQSLRGTRRVLVAAGWREGVPVVDVWSEPGVLVRLEEMVATAGAESEVLAEALLAMRLPYSWKHLVELPARRMESMVVRCWPASEEMAWQNRKRTLGLIREMTNGWRKT